MLDVRRKTGRSARRATALGLAALMLAATAMPVCAEKNEGFGWAWRHKKEKAPPPKPREWMQPSEPPVMSIPVDTLGFAAPSSYYEGQRMRFVSLDFLDENRLLFTFRAPGLIHRKPGQYGEEREIRALVLRLPLGSVESQAVWTLHDTDPYLWMLKDGHFLVRDRNNLAEGDASLDLKPFLTFPGPLEKVEMNPGQQYLVTDSLEPMVRNAQAGEVGSPATAQANVTTDGPQESSVPDMVLRILQRTTGKVMLVSRVRMRVHVPINAEGYMEVLQGTDHDWMLNLDYFSGGSRVVAKVESQCRPDVEFVAEKEALATTCDEDGALHLVVLSTQGKLLWQRATPDTEVWPIVVTGASGTRFARETLAVTQPVGPYSPLSFDNVKGQILRVYDSATGKVLLKAPASPVLDGGGNVAISPSGRRVAVLDGGSIRLYELSGNRPKTGSANAESSH